MYIRSILYLIFFDLVLAQLDDGILLPGLSIDLPIQHIQFSAQTGTSLKCDLKPPYQTDYTINWLVYSFLEQRFNQLKESELLKQVFSNNENYILFLPFKSDQFNSNLHNNYFRCFMTFNQNVVASRVIRVKALISRTIEVNVYDQQTELGGTALLRCAYPSELQSYVRVSGWLTDDGLIILPTATTLTSDPNLLIQKKYNLLSTGELFISKVDERDTNRRFRCQVINTLTGERSESASWARLTVTARNTKAGPPIYNMAESALVQPKSIFYAQQGDTLLLACLFSSRPNPTINWSKQNFSYKNNQSLSKIYPSNNRNLLLIPSVSIKDAGQYVCKANNSYGHSKIELELKLNTNLDIYLQSSTSIGQIDKPVTFNCSYTFSSENYEVIWYKNMEQIQIDNIKITSGQYENNFSKNDENKNLNEKFITVTNWLKIKSFQYSDAGVYQCFLRFTQTETRRIPILKSITYNRLSNSYFSSSVISSENSFNSHYSYNTIHLMVQEAEPNFTSTFNEQLKLPGNELSLKCVATGLPLPDIFWKINGFVISSSKYNIEKVQLNSQTILSFLNISSLSVSDGAYYSCVAKNAIGKIFNEARINVMGPPGINLHSPKMQNMTAVVGRSFNLHCPFYGYPLEKIIFYRNDKKILTDERRQERVSGQLIIQSIRKEDEGIYKCEVTSVTGEKNEAIIHLKTLTAPIISPFEFPLNLEEEMRTSLICSVTSGDPPVKMHWLKNGYIISSFDQSINSLSNNYETTEISETKLMFQIVSLNQFVSSLLINNLTSEYSGNYTCVASNDASSSSHSAFLKVKSKPKFSIRPLAKQLTVVGEPVRFDCQAIGFPQPVIRWKYIGNSNLLNVGSSVQLFDSRDRLGFTSASHSSSSSISILSNPRVHVLENGSLIIKQIQIEDQGGYNCEASNGIGKPIETLAQLLVFQAPRLKLSFDLSKTANNLNQNFLNRIVPSNIINYNSLSSNLNTITVKKGDQVSLICVALGTQLINIEWTLNGFLLPNNEMNNIVINSIFKDFSYTINEQLTGDQLKQSTLTFRLNDRNSSGIYRCQATNLWGQHYLSSKIFLQEPPSKPLLKSITNELTARSASIMWTIDYLGNSAITGYEIHYKKIPLTLNQHTVDKVKKTNQSENFLINGLNSTQHLFNSSEFDFSFTKQLFEQAQEEFFWKQANVQYLNSNEIQVGRSLSSSITMNSDLIKNVQLLGQYILNKLEPSNLYILRLRAQNSFGFSKFSNTILVFTKKEAPFIVPQNITCTSLNSRSIRINWKIPQILINTKNSILGQHSRQLIEGFYIGYRITESENTFNFLTLPTNNLIVETQSFNSYSLNNINMKYFSFNHTLDSLQKSTKYTIVVQAFNSEGAGPYSNEVFANTFNNDPPKPAYLRIESISYNNITVIWNKPNDLNSVQGFMLNYKAIMNSELNDQQKFLNNIPSDTWETIKLPKFTRRYTITNLNCGSRYIINLISFNEIGESEPSNELNISTKGNLPVAPSRSSFILPNITSANLNLNFWKGGHCLISHFYIKYKQKNDFQWKFHATIQVINSYQTNANNIQTEYQITRSNEIVSKSITYNSFQLIPSLAMASTYGQLVLFDLQSGTWHDLLVQVYNQAGKTEVNYLFSTLTLDGATVSPLVLSDEQNHLNVAVLSSNDFYLNLIFQHSSIVFIIILFILFVLFSVYLIYMKRKLHHTGQSINQFSKHQQDAVSLNSYSNNKISSSLALKSTNQLYDTSHNFDNNQEICNSCEQVDQTLYYPSIYATDPLSHLAVQQVMMPNYLTNKSNENRLNDNLDVILNANSNNCLQTNKSDYDFVETRVNNLNSNFYPVNCNTSNVINENTIDKIKSTNNCLIGIDNCNSKHVYDIPHRQAINEINKLKQLSTFRNVNNFE